ncbi:hypothetical protein [Actinosynnema sp. NPDC020468]|uniref:hypothetical protein n=1 Tax=Actinosynnema sp. NPDC020468 TaxID=3154488 RepID=UPI0033BFB8A7
MLIDELDSLVARLDALSRPVVGWLVPGLEPAAVEAVLGADLPAEVVAWFGWRDGVEVREGQVQDDVNVIPGYAPLSLAEAVAVREHYRGDPVLGEHWVPVLGGGGGDLYAAVWRPGEQARVAGVLVGESTEVEFAGVEQMIGFFNACYANGTFHVDANGHLAMDPDRYDETYARL